MGKILIALNFVRYKDMKPIDKRTEGMQLNDGFARWRDRTSRPTRDDVDESIALEGFLTHIRTIHEARGQREEAKRRLVSLHGKLQQTNGVDERRHREYKAEFARVKQHKDRALSWIFQWSKATEPGRLRILIAEKDQLAPQASRLLELIALASKQKGLSPGLRKEQDVLREQIGNAIVSRLPEEEMWK